MSSEKFLKYLNNKKALFIAVAVFILPFIIFSFWSFPAADDYMIIVKKSRFSFWQMQSFIYHNWTGRYFATFISGVFSYSGFLYSHYYLHSILLLVLTIFSWLFCLIQINKHLLNNHFTSASLVLFSMLLLIAEINIIPEPVTAFYWFSSAVTYQTPLIILIFLAGIIIKSLFTSFNIFWFIIACLLVISLNGCNEIITLFVQLLSAILVGFHLLKSKRLPKFITALFVLNIISACFLLFSPGIARRQVLLTHGSVFSAFGFAVVKFLIINWFFLKEPLWWFSVLFAVIFINNNRDLFKPFFAYFNKFNLWALLLIYTISGLLVYFPVMFITNGSLPLRAENIICFLYSLLLLFIISAGISRKINNASFFYKYRFLALSILIFSTANMKKVTDTLLSGFFYKQIMQQRISLLENAKQRNQHEVTFDGYKTAVDKEIKENFPAADRQMLRDIISKPPPVISFGEDLYDVGFLKEYYEIQKLNIGSK